MIKWKILVAVVFLLALASLMDEGRTLNRLGAGLGFARGRCLLALHYLSEEKDEDGLALLRKAAEQGYATAQVALAELLFLQSWGKMYDLTPVYYSWRFPRKYYEDKFPAFKAGGMVYVVKKIESAEYGEEGKEAVIWAKRAADQNNPIGKDVLGACYYCGIGVVEDEKIAFEWFRKSAKQGNVCAMLEVAYCYEQGRGVERSIAEAKEWYNKVKEQGNIKLPGNIRINLRSYAAERLNEIEE